MKAYGYIEGIGEFEPDKVVRAGSEQFLRIINGFISFPFPKIREVYGRIAEYGSGRFNMLMENEWGKPVSVNICMPKRREEPCKIPREIKTIRFQPEDMSFVGEAKLPVTGCIDLGAPYVMLSVIERNGYTGQESYLEVNAGLLLDYRESYSPERRDELLTIQRRGVIQNLELLLGLIPEGVPLKIKQ